MQKFSKQRCNTPYWKFILKYKLFNKCKINHNLQMKVSSRYKINHICATTFVSGVFCCFILTQAGHAASSVEIPNNSVEIKKIGSSGQPGFTRWIVVKTTTKSLCLFGITKSRSETKLSFFEMQSMKETLCGIAHSPHVFSGHWQRLIYSVFNTGVLKLNKRA